MAETGDLTGAATLFTAALEGSPAVADRAQAALGLAVVLDDLGDTEGARRADWAAIETGDPDYAPRAAYHLALSHERAGDPGGAAEAWRIVVASEHPAYLPAACLALAQLADDAGDADTAVGWWERVIDTGDAEYAPVAAHDLAQRLLEDGKPARAQRVLADALRGVDPGGYAYARLAVLIGLTHLDQAIGAFTAAVESTDAPDVAPLAVELLARTLRLRARDAEADSVWRAGLADPALADQVAARLQRDTPPA
ncbi:tetratricopeptide repeat protein [Actinocorallia sp. A-T 12471]|uniref:tetratricopeptide repeat protein n=1 Tax=Actinocorallia sp. A-T 12471 TaxID=3089813 RepID=UPI0029D2EDA3|nr:tetratricopeptide repeat protein [Actinocorallia sp. A-T 12471]MDX6739970.1 tetratricopeptide repeat protein [Actinocorallia sp. A-T 12471]